MSIEPANNNTKNLGGILLTIGWILCLMVIGFLYHKSLYSAKEAKIAIDQSEIKITIPRSFDSHYYLQGKINNQLIKFIIDTGATTVSIPENFARKINLNFGQMVKISTASGPADGHLTKISSLIIDPIEFNDLTAIIMPSMADEALLGMNVLKKFEILQTEDTLVLVYKRKSSSRN